MQGSPSARHVAPPQVCITGSQTWLQHSSSVAHCTPSGKHAFAPQWFVASQTWLQHSNALTQGCPDSLHTKPPQYFFVPDDPCGVLHGASPQQSLFELHSRPF